MALDGNHNVEEILGRNESWAILVLGLESNQCILIVEVMQELRKFCISDDSFSVFAKVQFDKVTRLQREGDVFVQAGFFDDLAELVKADCTAAISIK